MSTILGIAHGVIDMQTQEQQFLRYSHTIGLSTMEGRGFYYPTDTTVGANGRLYVVSRSLEGDNRGVRVTVTNADSEYFGTFAAWGEGDGQFIWPTAITQDSRERIFVSDEYTHRISVFDTDGTFLTRWGERGDAPGQIDGPSGLAFDRDDNLYVVDHLNNRVQIFTADGTFLSSFGSEGSGDGQLYLPWGITIDAKGEVYVADWRNDRVQRFSPEGSFVASYGTSGQGDGEFHRPADVAVDLDGYVYVADWGNERVQVLDPDGGFVASLRGEATHSKWAEEFLQINVEEADARAKADLEADIEFFEDTPYEESSHIEKLFWAPTSVVLDPEGRLYVTESNRHRLQVYERAV